MDRGTFAIALADYEGDENDPGHLLFKKGNRILVTHGNNDTWAWGRNELTRQEGKFPGSYVKFNV